MGEARRLDRAEQVLGPLRRFADQAHRGSFGKLAEAEQGGEVRLCRERHHGNRFGCQGRLDLVDVEERRDEDAVLADEGWVVARPLGQILHQHAVHGERQLGLELLAEARDLRPVALDHERPGPLRFSGSGDRGPGRRGGEEFLCGVAEPPRPL